MPNPYVNKVVQSNGTTLIDISDTTAVAADVAEGMYFYLATGEKVPGTASGGGGLQTENIIPEQSVNCTISIGSAYAGFIPTYSALPQNGEYYLVTVDGTEYIARAFNRSEGSLVLGDVRVQQGTAFVEYPFEIISESYFYIAVGTNGAHTLKVDRILSWN